MSLKNFLKNLKFLFKTKLTDTILNMTESEIIEQTLYEIPGNHVKRPNIIQIEDTIKALVEKPFSICRFGDGEIDIIYGGKIGFQKRDKKLAARLKEIIANSEENLLIGINYQYYYPNLEKQSSFVKKFYRTHVPKYRKKLSDIIDWNKQYCSAGFNQMYMTHNDYDFEKLYNSLRQIWNDKDITVICAKNAFKESTTRRQINQYNTIQYNIYDNARSIDYIYAPSRNSFSEYDSLLKEAVKIDKNRLIITMIGPAGKVLAMIYINLDTEFWIWDILQKIMTGIKRR